VASCGSRPFRGESGSVCAGWWNEGGREERRWCRAGRLAGTGRSVVVLVGEVSFGDVAAGLFSERARFVSMFGAGGKEDVGDVAAEDGGEDARCWSVF
jgi:hypothetical protein